MDMVMVYWGLNGYELKWERDREWEIIIWGWGMICFDRIC